MPNSIINEVKATIPDDPAIELSDVINDEKFLKAMQAIPFPDTTVNVDITNAGKMLEIGKF